MANFLSVRQLRRLRTLLRRSQTKGFTLIELLISIIIGAFISVLLLYMVVELTQTNQKDAARSRVQQDMQQAIDYIAEDLRSAVFVYNGECVTGTLGGVNSTNFGTACPGIVNYIPAAMNTGTRTPVLAFWRTETLPAAIAQLCKDNALQLANQDPDNPPPLVQAAVPCIAGASYSLVVYAVETANEPLWKGSARLIRYQLGQFKDNAATQNDQSAGYVNPLRSAEYSFQQWPLVLSNGSVTDRRTSEAIGGATPSLNDNPAQVLVDFVDNTNATASCDDPNGLTPQANQRGFYACVRGGGVNASNLNGQNQDILLTLIGNVLEGGRIESDLGQSGGRITPIQTRVLVRGVIQKQ